MSLQARIDQDMKAAMIAKDALRLSTLRFLKSALKYAAIEKKTDELEDADIRQTIQKQIKQRRESIEQFKSGNRTDLAEQESRELTVLETYLPRQMSDEDLRGLVLAKVKDNSAMSKKDFGRMMKILTEAVAGEAEPKRISEILGKILV